MIKDIFESKIVNRNDLGNNVISYSYEKTYSLDNNTFKQFISVHPYQQYGHVRIMATLYYWGSTGWQQFLFIDNTKYETDTTCSLNSLKDFNDIELNDEDGVEKLVNSISKDLIEKSKVLKWS